jgi:hypothetical protein
MTLSELRDLAKKVNVDIPSRIRKADLVAVLASATKKGSPKLESKGAKGSGRQAGMGLKDVRTIPGITEEEKVEAAKYDFPASLERPEAEGLPEEYGGNRVRLMARDPYWAHAYWEVSINEMDRVRRSLGDPAARLTLRVCDATDVENVKGNGHALSLFDIDVFQRIGNWYIELGRPDRTFYVEIGMKDKGGRFEGIARSNRIQSPRDSVSDVTDLEWMIGEEEFRKVFAISGGYGIGLSSAEMVEVMEKRFRGEVSSPGAWSPGVSSPGAWSLFSPGRRPQQRERGFWFWVNTELIVYGATEPDATVTFQGKPIPLKSDGTFSLRFALPDGLQVMPIRAASADGEEERVITPIVSRETK